ncbi:MAG TPA: glycoside hydrolase family 15 protein [Nordella sp.]|nr:glycoside hydrolase family 15 protein [Nordella sp.]
MSDTLEDWIARQYRFSARAMLEAVSATHITQIRPGFGQTVTPKPGSIVASPVLAAWNPDPDYFFQWFRDSAVVIDALRVLQEDNTLGVEALTHFHDFVRFSLSLPHQAAARGQTLPDFQQYLRPDAELAAMRPEDVAAETRVNPDGTLDISRWSRPQHDGPALRLLALLRWLTSDAPLNAQCRADAARLAKADIDFILRHQGEPAFDMWEEEQGQHYYTLRAEATALVKATTWLDAQDDTRAEACRAAVSTLQRRLDAFWREQDGFYSSRLSGNPGKYLDMSVIFAVIHADDEGPLHTLRDVRMLATLRKLEALFDRLYAINHGRPANRAPAMGRYEGDVYFSGGAYYFSTLAAAEFYFRLAAENSGAMAQRYFAQGDGFLETVRAFTPDSGELSEQFDRNTGQQTSAKELAWSYAAFITAIAARNSCDEAQ